MRPLSPSYCIGKRDAITQTIIILLSLSYYYIEQYSPIQMKCQNAYEFCEEEAFFNKFDLIALKLMQTIN